MSGQISPGATSAQGAGGNRHLLIAFAKLVAPFWRTRASTKAWVLLALFVGSLLLQAKAAVFLNDRSGVLTNALVAKDLTKLQSTALVLLVITLGTVLLDISQSYLRMWIEIDWRIWLTRHFADRWLSQYNYYRMERDGSVDNPDQRISEDVFLMVDQTLALFSDVAYQITRVIAYSTVLWGLGGALRLTWKATSLSLPNGIFWSTWIILLGFLATMIAVGRPLVRLNIDRQRKEADYRFAMANIRMNAEQVALYDGARAEAVRLNGLFDRIVLNWRSIMIATAAMMLVVMFYQRLVGLGMNIPGYSQYMRGEIDYGKFTQISAAVMAIAIALSWFARQMQSGSFFIWASAVKRLGAFDVELGKPEVRGIVLTERQSDANGPLLETSGLQLARPDGTALAAPGDLAFRAGERWLVRGESGVGKSMMMRAIAGLWPHGSGSVSFNAQTRARTLFLPQKSYVPTGTLIDALSYPASHGSFTHEQCRQVLSWVHLEGLTEKLDTTAVWQQQLSPGEQQRLAFARVFLHAPEVVLLDEATSALDPANETRLYALLDKQLPDALVISIAHRDALEAFHSRSIILAR
ncbi:ABC transporter ATP-binding protein/permease [Xanthomonas campestris pv. zinniae]|uniref:ABC transporter ATP-binding protein/permease n=1 Tax=Xanthomonas cannabis TaxID=1885674 RepID=UPI001E305135|nr:ABC transporter ATP-binding protein/permease [Xanthomonas campestris pv. zinniae]